MYCCTFLTSKSLIFTGLKMKETLFEVGLIMLPNKIRSFLFTITVTRPYESSISRIGQAPSGISKIIARTVVTSISRISTDLRKRVAALNLLMNTIVRILTSERKA